MFGLVLALLFLVVLLWLFAGGSQRKVTNPALGQVRKDLKIILKDLRVEEPSYKLEEGSSSYFTTSRFGGNKIVLKVTESYNSLLLAACHEMAHLLCGEEGHGPHFQKWEKVLQEKAQKKGLLKKLTVEKDYPCLMPEEALPNQ